MSVILGLLNSARLHVHLLACQLLHLIAVSLLDKRLDGVEFGRTTGAHSHLRHFWR